MSGEKADYWSRPSLAGLLDSFSEVERERLGRIYRESRKAKRPGGFVAEVAGDSMNRVAPDGACCPWSRLGEADGR